MSMLHTLVWSAACEPWSTNHDGSTPMPVCITCSYSSLPAHYILTHTIWHITYHITVSAQHSTTPIHRCRVGTQDQNTKPRSSSGRWDLCMYVAICRVLVSVYMHVCLWVSVCIRTYVWMCPSTFAPSTTPTYSTWVSSTSTFACASLETSFLSSLRLSF